MIKQNSVFVLDTAKRQMTSCAPARARQLMKDGKAAGDGQSRSGQ